jgi:hypothetical protein
MPDLAEQIRSVIDAGGSSISADEVMYRASEGSAPARRHAKRSPRLRPARGPAIAWAIAVTVAGVATVVGLKVSAQTTPAAPAKALSTRTFSVGVDHVTFSYPSDWQAHQYPVDQSMFLSSVVFVASQALHNPCTTTHGSAPGPIESRSCKYAVDRLAANGVYLIWWFGGGVPPPKGSPKDSTVTRAGSPITVGGEPGTIDIERPACTALGGMESIDVDVGNDSNGWLMQACLSGPDLHRSADQVYALLRSTRF